MKEWREENYPPWAHGPGYVVSSDIAKSVSQRYKKGSLKVRNNPTATKMHYLAYR